MALRGLAVCTNQYLWLSQFVFCELRFSELHTVRGCRHPSRSAIAGIWPFNKAEILRSSSVRRFRSRLARKKIGALVSSQGYTLLSSNHAALLCCDFKRMRPTPVMLATSISENGD